MKSWPFVIIAQDECWGGVQLHITILEKRDLLLKIRRINTQGQYFRDFMGPRVRVQKLLFPSHRRLSLLLLCSHHTLHLTTMKSAIATLALAASVSAFAPAPVTKSSTALNDVWDSYSELFFTSSEIVYSYIVWRLIVWSSNSTVAPPSFPLFISVFQIYTSNFFESSKNFGTQSHHTITV